jgi:hypothetical protein
MGQLQEVRTAPAAHVMGGWQEGPVTPSSRRSRLAKQARGGGEVAFGRKGRQRPSYRVLLAMPWTTLLVIGGWRKGSIEACLFPLLGSMRTIVETRNAEDRREVPGGSGGPRRSRAC